MKKTKFPKAELTTRKKVVNRTQEWYLNQFYDKYGVRLVSDEEEIDLTAPPKGNGLFIAKDISAITFNKCNKLTMSIPMNQIKELVPKMPELTYLGLIFCKLGRFFLRWHAFKNLEILDLTGNDINKAESAFGVKNLPNLKTLILSENPVCRNLEERAKLKDHLNNIEIIFD